MPERTAVTARTAAAVLLGLSGLLGSAAVPASGADLGPRTRAAAGEDSGFACRPPATPPPEECDNELPQVLNVGLPYVEGVSLDDLEGSLRTVIGERYRACALCPERHLRVNVALGSDYQILDWLDRGLVDMGVVPALGLHLLRRDGIDLVEIHDPQAREMAQLVGRVPDLRETRSEGGEIRTEGRPDSVLDDFAAELWAWVTAGSEQERETLTDPGSLVMPSHLSTAGFLIPVLRIDDALDRLPEAEEVAPEGRRRFWQAFYERVCFRFGPDLGRRDGAACAATEGSPRLEVEVVDQTDDNLDLMGPPSIGRRISYRDRLVIRRGAIDSVFAPETIPVRELSLWDEIHRLRELLARTVEDGDEEVPVPTAFDDFLIPDGYFGTRTFAFRMGETLDLIALHQRIASRANLSLVLPGGGVKAAYQSRVLDRLYGPSGPADSSGEGGPPRLRNVGAEVGPGAGDDGEDGLRPLRVDSVVGTSGGALLGFFVARLGPNGPGDLASILWQPDPDGEPDRYVTATEIFGWTDLPRYISLVLILCVFGAMLAPFSWRRSGFLSPDRSPAGEARAAEPTMRWAVLGVVLGLLFFTPLVVSWVSDTLAEEHVPEFEGLLYAVLLVLGTFADQCLVRREETSRQAAGRRTANEGEGGLDLRAVLPVALLVLGGALVLGPVLLRLFLPELQIGDESLLEGRVTTGGAYLVLGSIAAGFGLLAAGWRRLSGLGWWNLLAWPAAFAVGTVCAWLILRAFGEAALDRIDRTPLLFLALGAALALSLLVRLVRGAQDGSDRKLVRWVRKVGTEVAHLFVGHRIARFLGLGAIAFLGCLIVLDLTRPPAESFVTTGFWELVGAKSKLDAPRGPLAVCLGAVFLMLGTILTLDRRPNGYRLEGQDRYRDAVLVTITGLAFAVYAGLAVTVALIQWLDGHPGLADSALLDRLASLTLFELTPSFWIGLAVASVVGSIVLIRWAWKGAGEEAGGFRKAIHRSLSYLCGTHPNAHLVPRRVVRLGVMAIGGLFWWNFVLAPALYGNRYAIEYMETANERFVEAYQERHGDSSYRLTASYLAPANALAIDGTRFVLAVRDGEDCPVVPESPGVTWRQFRIVSGDASALEDDCTELRLADEEDRAELQNYIFASGSPFPAFPPKLVRTFDEAADEREALVDGGYSNNVPIQAASKIGARQVLVIHSSHPRPQPSGESWLFALGGPLVDNVPRLLGFLYDRSQQLDRRSRSDLFVASLAPRPADDWPILTDFREATVERMIEQAGEDLREQRRIGMVESWGPPEFQSSLRVPEE